MDNTSAARYPDVTVRATMGQSGVSEAGGHVFVPRTPEVFAYDDDANLLSDGRWAYTWDGENRLIGMESIASVPVAAKRKLSFAYDYQSRRSASRTQLWDAGASAWAYGALHQYVYDGWNLVAELVDGVRVSTYVWGLDFSGSMQGAGGAGGLLSVSQSQSGGGPWQTSYAIPDANGNVMMLVDAQTLETAAQYEYGPFGELIRRNGPRAKSNPFRFSSKYQDEESGLLYYGYRYYDANTGRWLSRDPIGEEGGINLYRFLKNNQTNKIDLLGLLDVSDLSLIASNKPWPTLSLLLSRWGSAPYTGKKQDPYNIAMKWVLSDPDSKRKFIEATTKKYKEPAALKLIQRVLNRRMVLGPGYKGNIDFTAMSPQKNYEGNWFVDYNAVVPLKEEFLVWNDVQASLHRFVFYTAIKAEMCPNRTAKIKELGVYVKDSFDFEGTQDLGWWGLTATIAPGHFPGSEHITNEWFREWRLKNGKGADFDIYTEWRRVKIPEFEVSY